MLLKNNVARLITINGADGTSYAILPGDNPAVDVPDELCRGDFVKHLLKSRQLVKDDGVKDDGVSDDGVSDDESDDDQGGTELDELRSQADLLGIKYADNWGAKRLRTAIDKASA